MVVYESILAEIVETRPLPIPRKTGNLIYVFRDSDRVEWKVGGIINPKKALTLNGYYDSREEAVEAAVEGDRMLMEYYSKTKGKWG